MITANYCFIKKRARSLLESTRLLKNGRRQCQRRKYRGKFRSATSIGANIAKGHGRHEGTEYIHYLIIAQGPANETDHWLRTIMDVGLSPKEKLHAPVEQNNEVRRMLTASINTLKAKRDEHKTCKESSPYNFDTNSSND